MHAVDALRSPAIASRPSVGDVSVKIQNGDEDEFVDPDTLLVEAMADGDRTALARLYDRHAPMLLALATRVLGAADEAEDLVHDVLLEAWHRALDFDPRRGSVRTWLALRTRSRALDRLRMRGRRGAVEAPDDEAGERPVVPASHDGEPSLTSDRHRVRVALSNLPPPQRFVLEQAYFEGLSAAEIAERSGVPLGTIKSRTAAGLARLRELFRAAGGA